MSPLKNYTSTVPVHRTLTNINKLLLRAGAHEISTSYVNGSPTGVTFTVPTLHGPRRFKLPVNTDAVVKVLTDDYSVPTRYATPEHGERVAWRIVKDWLDAQLAIIETEMVTLDQLMLPYMQTDEGVSVYELYRSGVERFELGAGQ